LVFDVIAGRLAQSAATERSIFETLAAYPAVVKSLYKHFTFLHCPYVTDGCSLLEPVVRLLIFFPFPPYHAFSPLERTSPLPFSRGD
jgi:hypothetical protein